MADRAAGEGAAARRYAGAELLGLDAACLAAMDVPAARRLTGAATWARASLVGAAAAGGCLAWVAEAPFAGPFLAAGTAAFTLVLVRLGMVAGAASHLGEEAVATWRPGRGAAGVLLVFGAVLAQPVVAVVERVGLGGGGGGFAGAVAAAWATPVGPALTVAGALLVASPGLARLAAPRALRQYERIRVRRERARVELAWERSEARVRALLAPWPTFSGELRPVSVDPPFDEDPLLLGRERGERVAADIGALRAHLPGFDGACTVGGRRRAAEVARLSLQLAGAAGESRPARYHRARTVRLRAEAVLPVDRPAALRDAREALALLDALLGERLPSGEPLPAGERVTLAAEKVAVARVLLALAGDADLPRDEAIPLAEGAAADLLALRPTSLPARQLQARVLARLAADTPARMSSSEPDRRQALRREALARAVGTEDEGAARRNLARALLPRGGAEATALGEAGLALARASGDDRALAAAHDLAAVLSPSAATGHLDRALALLEARWRDDPTPAATLDLAVALEARALKDVQPHEAKAHHARAVALGESALGRHPRAEAIVAAVRAHRRLLLEE